MGGRQPRHRGLRAGGRGDPAGGDARLSLARGPSGGGRRVARPPARPHRRRRNAGVGMGAAAVSPFSSATVKALRRAGLDPAAVERVVAVALQEDLGPVGGVDVTSEATIPADQTDTGDVVARADGVVAGLPVAAAVFDLAGAGRLRFDAVAAEGQRVARGDVLASVTGPT